MSKVRLNSTQDTERNQKRKIRRTPKSIKVVIRVFKPVHSTFVRAVRMYRYVWSMKFMTGRI